MQGLCDRGCFRPKVNKVFHAIHYANRTLNEARLNYATTKIKLLAILFAFDKFQPYLIGNKVIVYMNHSAIKYLMAKKYAKPRLIVTPPIPVRPDWRIRTGFGVRNHILGLIIIFFFFLNQQPFTFKNELPPEWYPLKFIHVY